MFVKRRLMTQDERWMARYNEVMDFINTNHRNPSKYYDGDKLLVHFMKHSRKQMNAGILKPERVEKLKALLELSEQYKRKNQYQ